MAVSTTTTYSGPYFPNGVTVAFPFDFKALTKEEVSVILRIDGVDTIADPSSYTVTLSEEGGTATFASAPASGSELYVASDPLFTQTAKFSNQAYNPTTLNALFDRDAVRAKHLKGLVDRAVSAPIGEAGLRLPVATDRANKYAAYDAVGLPIALSGSAPPDQLALPDGAALIGTQASGTDAIPETAQDVFDRLPVSPEQFSGADASAKINKAIDKAAAAGGGVVELEARTYEVSAPIQLKSNVTLRGKGAGVTVIKRVGDKTVWQGYANLTGIVTTLATGEYENIAVERLTVDGDYVDPVPFGPPPYAKNGISLANLKNSRVSDCEVLNSGTGIIMYGTVTGTTYYKNVIERCRTSNTKSWIVPDTPGTPRAITMATNHSTVSDCQVENCHTGYYVATDYGTYRNCRVTGWVDDGFYVNANYCTFEFCRAHDGTGSGIAINPSTGHRVIGFEGVACGNAGIRIRHIADLTSSRVTIQDCLFDSCGYGFLDDMTGVDAYPSAVGLGNRFINNLAVNNQKSGFKFIRQQAGVMLGNVALNNNQSGVDLQSRGGISLDEGCIGNEINGNICHDPQGVPTQTFGLYSYPASVHGAPVENTGNRINHKSLTGTDLFFPRVQRGQVTATVPSGASAVAPEPTTVFPMAFEGKPRIRLWIDDGPMDDAEFPWSAMAFFVTATGFRYRVDLAANATADRVITVNWEATYGDL